MRYCYYEERDYPESQFERVADVRIHKRHPVHTEDGQLIGGEASVPINVPIQIPDHFAPMSAEDQSRIDTIRRSLDRDEP